MSTKRRPSWRKLTPSDASQFSDTYPGLENRISTHLDHLSTDAVGSGEVYNEYWSVSEKQVDRKITVFERFGPV